MDGADIEKVNLLNGAKCERDEPIDKIIGSNALPSTHTAHDIPDISIPLSLICERESAVTFPDPLVPSARVPKVKYPSCNIHVNFSPHFTVL